MHTFLPPHHSFPFPSVLLGAAALLALSGCYTSETAYEPSPRYVTVVNPGDYLYYPAYEVYYSNRQRVYFYREGNVWVSRPQPPRVWARALRRAPSVHVHFQDAPERHHQEVVRTYPKNWRPPATRQRDHRDHRRDDRDRDGRADNQR